MDTIRETPPTMLRVQRIQRGIKPWRLAEQLGISLSLYYLYEQGRKVVPMNVRRRIAECMDGVPVESIFPEDEWRSGQQ